MLMTHDKLPKINTKKETCIIILFNDGNIDAIHIFFLFHFYIFYVLFIEFYDENKLA